MTAAQLARIFQKEVPRPTAVFGDPWGTEATTEEIWGLIDTPPDELTAEDFMNYLGFCTTGGDDDLRYLLPPILRIWEEEFGQRDSAYVQHFHREICRTDFVDRALGKPLRQAVIEFMVRALSEWMAAENSLRVQGFCSSHVWVGCVASFGVMTTEFPALWNRVWESTRRGHAVALLQYLSCLLYEDEENPIFAPWTCNQGGGPPQLWDYESAGFDESWKDENLEFLAAALTPESIHTWLQRIAVAHAGDQVETVALEFLRQLNDHPSKADERIALLLLAIQVPSGIGPRTWTSLRD